MADPEQSDVAALTVQLLSAYLVNNTVAHTDIADLVRTTKAALLEEQAPLPVEPRAPEHVPAVSTRKSLASPDHILSLIDGKPYKTLKRHLAKHGLTPANYRQRYNLPANYPMVAPGFAAARRAIAEKIGLGRKPVIARSIPPTKISALLSEEAVTSPAQTNAPAPTPVYDVSSATPKHKAAPEPKTQSTAKAMTRARAKPAAAKKPRAVAATASFAADLASNSGADESAKGVAPSQDTRGTLRLFKSQDGAADASKPKTPAKAPRAKRRPLARNVSSAAGQDPIDA